jgi:hypothetical protein
VGIQCALIYLTLGGIVSRQTRRLITKAYFLSVALLPALAINRLRQQMGHVPARRSHPLDPGDNPCDQPGVRLKGCYLMWPSRRCRQDVREGSSQVSQKFAAGPVSRAGSLNQSDLLSTKSPEEGENLI